MRIALKWKVDGSEKHKERAIVRAIKKIKRSEVPKGRRSREFLLEFEGEFYTLKYIITDQQMC